MKIFVAGSRKFFQQIEELVAQLKRRGIVAVTAGKEKNETSAENESCALLRAFKEIDCADVVYVYAEGGYIGKTVCLEIGYAFAKGKEIISSEEVNEAAVKGLISKVILPVNLNKDVK